MDEKKLTYDEFLAQHAKDFPEYEDDNGEESLAIGLNLMEEYIKKYGKIE